MTDTVDVMLAPESWPVEVLAEYVMPPSFARDGSFLPPFPTNSVTVLLSTAQEAATLPFPGQTVRLRAQFLRRTAASGDAGGYSSVPFNPYGLSVKIKAPNGDVDDVTSDAENSGTGHYFLDFTPDQAGVHHVRWAGHDGSGGPLGVGEAPLHVETSDVI